MGIPRVLCLAMSCIILLPMTAPAVVAEWEDDNWLRNIIGPERLELGDEFGCHGFEGVDVREESWVIEECRD